MSTDSNEDKARNRMLEETAEVGRRITDPGSKASGRSRSASDETEQGILKPESNEVRTGSRLGEQVARSGEPKRPR